MTIDNIPYDVLYLLLECAASQPDVSIQDFRSFVLSSRSLHSAYTENKAKLLLAFQTKLKALTGSSYNLAQTLVWIKHPWTGDGTNYPTFAQMHISQLVVPAIKNHAHVAAVARQIERRAAHDEEGKLSTALWLKGTYYYAVYGWRINLAPRMKALGCEKAISVDRLINNFAHHLIVQLEFLCKDIYPTKEFYNSPVGERLNFWYLCLVDAESDSMRLLADLMEIWDTAYWKQLDPAKPEDLNSRKEQTATMELLFERIVFDESKSTFYFKFPSIFEGKTKEKQERFMRRNRDEWYKLPPDWRENELLHPTFIME